MSYTCFVSIMYKSVHFNSVNQSSNSNWIHPTYQGTLLRLRGLNLEFWSPSPNCMPCIMYCVLADPRCTASTVLMNGTVWNASRFIDSTLWGVVVSVTDLCTTGNEVYSCGCWSTSKPRTQKFCCIMSDEFLRHEAAVLGHLSRRVFSVRSASTRLRCFLHLAAQKIYKTCEVQSTAIITGMLLKAKCSHRLNLLILFIDTVF